MASFKFKTLTIYPFTRLQGKAKYNSWTSRKGLSQDAAKKEYCELVKQLKDKYN